jgi:ribonucleoside-diphosphate reductase alpha chain
MLGMQYGDEASVAFAEKVAQVIRDAAYMASVELAAEKGTFPLFDVDKYLKGKFVATLPDYIKEAIRANGIRNSHLLTIAPTGTTSLMWGNISSGVEPIFSLTVNRKIKEGEGKEREVVIDDYAYSLYKKNGSNGSDPDVMVSSKVPANGHIDIMAAFQQYVDASISKTIVFDPNTSFEEFKETYLYAYDKRLKGCTVYRESGKIAAVIKAAKPEQEYIIPERLPEYRVKHSFKVDTPEGGMYVDVTEVGGKPKEVWVVTPVDAGRPEDLDAICKLASICLRANIHPDEVLRQITTSIRKYGHVSSMLAFVERGMRRGFAKILGEKSAVAGKPCPICGQPLVYRDSCVKCSSCDYDKCA